MSRASSRPAEAAGRQRRTEAVMRAVLETTVDGIIIIDSRGIIQRFNHAAERMFGYPAAKVIGRNVSLLMPSPHREVHDGYLADYLRTGVRRIIGIGREVLGRRRDGSEFPIDLAVSELRVGRQRLFTGVVRDITERKRAEDALYRSREQYQALLDSIDGIVWEADPVTLAFAFISRQAERLLGYPTAEWLADPGFWLDHMHPDDRECSVATLREAARDRAPRECEYRMRAADDRWVWLRDLISVTDGDGAPRLRGVMVDITKRRQAQDALVTLSSAVEQTADHVMITTRDGVITYVNPAFEQHTGYPRDAVLGATPRVLKSGQHAPAFYQELWETILAGGVFRGVFLNRKHSGELYVEEKTIAPIRDSQGWITHFVSTGRDITARQVAEERQRELQAAIERSAVEWRLTFDAVESPVVVVDAGGRVKRMNRAARDLVGEAYDVLMGRAVEELGPGEPWVAGAEMVRTVRRTRAPGSVQSCDPVTRRAWDVDASLIAAPAGGGDQVIVVARDITRLVELRESLRRSQLMAAMGALVAGVAHEVRNPLFAILATLDAFEAHTGGTTEYREYLRVLRQEAARLRELMHDLMEYGRPVKLELAPGILREVVDAAIQSCASLATERGVTIRNRLPEILPPLSMDAGRMRQVFRNLIENGVHHSARGGVVTITGRRHDKGKYGWIEVQVRDTGLGIGAEELPRIFEPFFTGRRGGTGLGLSIVQRVVEQHGATVWAANHASGGAVLTVRLPIGPPETQCVGAPAP